MGLRSISLKEEYRSDRDDIVSEFFFPCLSNSTEYNRCIEYMSVKSLSTIVLSMHDRHSAKLRIIAGHRFTSFDVSVLTKLFVHHAKLHVPELIRDAKIAVLGQMIRDKTLEIRIAIPNSEFVDGMFCEKIGVFVDGAGDAVAFSGTSNHTFDRQNRDFETVDVFTSWQDATRVQAKRDNFESLWSNKTKYVDVHTFEYAEENNLIKYSPEWVIDW